MGTILIKLSGKKIDEITNSKSFTEIIKSFRALNKRIIIAHGGGKQITEWADKLGIKSQFIDGQRVTNKGMMDVVAAIQAGLINKTIVAHLNKNNLNAIGISGIDGNSFKAVIENAKLGFVGKAVQNNSTQWINTLIQNNLIPVFSSICMDAKGNLINVNADLFVEELAKALQIQEVYYYSDIAGIMIKNKVKKQLTSKEIYHWIMKGEIKGGMLPKVRSAISLAKYGVNKIWIGNNFEFKNNSINGGTEIVSGY